LFFMREEIFGEVVTGRALLGDAGWDDSEIGVPAPPDHPLPESAQFDKAYKHMRVAAPASEESQVASFKVSDHSPPDARIVSIQGNLDAIAANSPM
jgi:hypothetical protein